MNIDYNAIIEILKSFLNNEKIEILGISVGEERQVKDAIRNLLTAYEKEKEKNKNAYRKANNYLYFNDSADYEVALWEVVRTLRPDLADKWDNGEDAVLEYIEEE